MKRSPKSEARRAERGGDVIFGEGTDRYPHQLGGLLKERCNLPSGVRVRAPENVVLVHFGASKIK